MDVNIKSKDNGVNANSNLNSVKRRAEDEISGQGNTNLSAENIDADVMQKLRGDAIGDTVYSESFVAKTLLQLSDLEWSEKLEEDLCFLWDMTLEKDVCDYLLQLSYPTIACSVISKHNENRLLEIVIGILANICCITDATEVTEEQIELVLSMLSSDDALILIQVARFVKAIAYNRETLPFINEQVFEQINFILVNSCNNELLVNTLDAVSKITADTKMNVELLNGQLVSSSIIAYQCVLNSERERLSLAEDQIETSQQRAALTHLIQIISNICSYVNSEKTNRLFSEVNQNVESFINELVKVFSCYSRDESLLPISEELQFYIEALIFIFQVLTLKYQSQIFTNLIKITNILLKSKCEEVVLFLELCCYFIYVGSLDELKQDLHSIEKAEMLSVLNKIKAEKSLYDFSYEDNLQALIVEFKIE